MNVIKIKHNKTHKLSQLYLINYYITYFSYLVLFRVFSHRSQGRCFVIAVKTAVFDNFHAKFALVRSDTTSHATGNSYTDNTECIIQYTAAKTPETPEISDKLHFVTKSTLRVLKV